VKLKEKSKFSRRQFLQRTSAGLSIAGVAGGSTLAFSDPNQAAKETTAPPAKWPAHGAANVTEPNALKPYKIWDVHTHLFGFAGATIEEKVDDCLRFADRMGVERMLVLTSAQYGHAPDGDRLRAGNDVTIKAVKHAPDRLFGCAFMYPGSLQACLDEIDRCVGEGPCIGLKFEFDTAAGADTPELDAIMERAGKYKAVILHHTWIKTNGNMEGESTPMQLAAVCRRHPDVTMFCGHTGGNWELGIRAIRDVKNMYCDLSGSDPVAGYTEMAVRELGAERVLYGSDIQGRSFASQIGKVMGADIPDSTRRLILRENMRRLVQPILKAKGIKA
jgi:hypothetical protein